MISTRRLRWGLLLTASASLLSCAQAYAQVAKATAPTAAKPTAQGDEGALEAVIVTGVGRGQRQFDASFAVSTLSQAAIQKLAPLNFANLLGQVPGIYTEATGGEVQNVIRLRGIPNESSFVAFQEDGLPIYPDEGFFFKGDGVIRPDLMIQNMDIVRGGPAPIFASNAAAIINGVTRRGGETAEGALQVTVGEHNLYRLDGYWSGKVADKTYLALGGFLRRDDGARSNGFTNDRGGQFRVNLRREIEDGEVRAYVKVLDDHNVFYLPIPVSDPRNPSVSLDKYIDFFSGTLNTPYLQNAVMLYPNETGQTQVENRDLSNGRHTKIFTAGLDFEKAFGEFRVSNKFRVTDIDLDFDALYSTANPVDANTFASSYLARAKTAFGQTVPVARMGYAIAGTSGQTVYDPSSASGLVIQAQYRSIQTQSSAVQNETRVAHDVELFGKHELVGGLYLTEYKTTAKSRYQDYLFELKSNPRLIDLVAYGTAGQVLGSVTDKGALRYSTNLSGGQSDFKEWALFFTDTWSLTDKLRIDYGFRDEHYDATGFTRLTKVTDLAIPGSLAGATALGFNGQIARTTYSTNNTAWTLGANYDYSRRIGVYARASKSYRIGGETALLFGGSPVTTAAEQYEIGAKLNTRQLSVFLTGFYTKFAPFITTAPAFNPQTGAIQNLSFVGEAISPGVEVDINWKPASFFTLDGSLTYNDAKLQNFASGVGASAVSIEGNQPIRQPKVYGNIRPSVHFGVGSADFDIDLRYNFVGDRYVDLQNRTLLPAFETLAGGVTMTQGDWKVQVTGDNLTNARGLTEGNPRSDVIDGQGSLTAAYGRPLYGRSYRLIVAYRW